MTSSPFLKSLKRGDKDFVEVEKDMQTTILPKHAHDEFGGQFDRYEIISIHKVDNTELLKRYEKRCQEIAKENSDVTREKLLYHGTPNVDDIVTKGFDENYARSGGLFGKGLYFARHSSKSNQYVLEINGRTGCVEHQNKTCYDCPRQMLRCRVALGKSYELVNSEKMDDSPRGYHSVTGEPSREGLDFIEYVVYDGDQVYPEYVITYKIVKPIK